jgi:hypothetical protein
MGQKINDYRISPICLIAVTTPPHTNPHPHRLSLILCYSVCVFRLQFYNYVNHRNVRGLGMMDVGGQIEITNSRLILCLISLSPPLSFINCANCINNEPIPVAAPSKAWVCGRSLAEIAGSNTGGGLWCVSLVSVVCQAEVSATDWSLI